MQIRILYVDDNEGDLRTFKKSIETEWNGRRYDGMCESTIEVTTRQDLPELFLVDATGNSVGEFDAVLLDIHWELRGNHGVELAAKIRSLVPTIPVFMLTELPNAETYRRLLQIGIDDFLLKDQAGSDLCVQIWEGIGRARRTRKGHALFKQVLRCTGAGAWEGARICRAASLVWVQGRPLDRWLGFWREIDHILAPRAIVSIFRDMRDCFSNADLLLLGSVSHMRGHLEHVLSVFFTGYVISNSSQSFKTCAIKQARTLANSFGLDGLGEEELWYLFQVAWLGAATLHDTAYSIELLGDIHEKCKSIAEVFRSVVDTSTGLQGQWDAPTVPDTFHGRLREIVGVFDKLYGVNPFDFKFLEAHTQFAKHGKERLNHGVVSGVRFLDGFLTKFPVAERALYAPFVCWAAGAMCLHSLKVPGMQNKKVISMERDALSWLLMVCDEIQVWDRERPDANLHGSAFRDSHIVGFSVSDSTADYGIDCLIEMVPYREAMAGPSYQLGRDEAGAQIEKDRLILSSYLQSSIKVRLRRQIAYDSEYQFPDVKF